MSDLRTGGGGGAVAHADAAPGVEGDLPAGIVGDLFVVLAKALRAYQLYEENNPVRRRFVEGLREAFQGVWARADRLSLTVEEDRIALGGADVYRADSRADSLAFLFYKDGVRRITFLPGIEAEELERFLSVLQRARKLLPEGDDLLTVLWEEDLAHFEYQYIDFLAEGVELPEPGRRHERRELKAVLDAEFGGEGVAEEEVEEASAGEGSPGEAPPRTVSKEDFNPTLYSLDPREMQTLQAELGKEVERDLRMDVLAALFDRLEEPGDAERQSEILDILATLLPNFLSRGALVAATHVLHELRSLEARADVFDEDRVARSRAVVDEASRPEFITELIHALYYGTLRASPRQLADFLRFMRAGALEPLLRASETVDHKELQAVLREATRGIADRNRGALVRLMRQEDAVVASSAARLAGEMGLAEAGPVLAELLARSEASVRLAAVEAAASLKASTAAGALEHTLDDPDRDVRVAAARALGRLGYRPAARRLAEIVSGKEIRQADVTEKVAVFEAYALVAGVESVPLLDRLLNGKGFLGKREPGEVRAAAALALGRVSDASANQALRKASGEDDPVVRSAVGRALRSEG